MKDRLRLAYWKIRLRIARKVHGVINMSLTNWGPPWSDGRKADVLRAIVRSIEHRFDDGVEIEGPV